MPERAPLLWVICIRELYVSVICIVDVNDSPVASVNHKALQLLLFLCKHSLVDADCSCSTYLLFSDWISCLTVAWHVIASIDQVFLHPNAVGRRRRGTRSTWPDRINFRRLTEWPLSCVDPLMSWIPLKNWFQRIRQLYRTPLYHLKTDIVVIWLPSG